MEHKAPAQNGGAPAQLPQISGFVSMAITEGNAAMKNWKPVWGTNVNTPAQPYTLSFYESPSECAQGAAPIVTVSLKEYTTKAIKIKVADSVDVNNAAALKLGFQITPKAVPGKDPSEVPSKSYFLLPKPAEANNWNVAFRDLYGSMVRKVVKRTLPALKTAPGTKVQAKQPPKMATKSDPQQGHPVAKQQPPKTQQPQAKQQQKVQPTQKPPQQSPKTEGDKHDEKETPKEEVKSGAEESEVIQTVIVETKSGVMSEEKEENDGPFRSKRCPIPKHISRRWKESPIAALTMSMNADGTPKSGTTWGAAKPTMKESTQKHFLQSKNVPTQAKFEAKAPRSLPVLNGGRSASLSQHRIVINNGAAQAKKAPEAATKVQTPTEKLDTHDTSKPETATEKQTTQPTDESHSAAAQQQKKPESTEEPHTEKVLVKKQQQQSAGELHTLKSSQSACLPVKKQGMPQTKNGPIATKVSPTGKLLVKKQHLPGEAPTGKGAPSMNPPMKKQQIAPQGKNGFALKTSQSACLSVKKQQAPGDPLVARKTNPAGMPVKKQPLPADGVGSKCVVSKKVIVKSGVGVKKQTPLEAGGSGGAGGEKAPGQVVAKGDANVKKTQVLVKKQQAPKGQGNLVLKKSQSCKIQTGMKMQTRALPVVKKMGVKTQIKEVPSASQVDKEKGPVGSGDTETKAKEAEMEQKRKQEEEKAAAEKLRIEKEKEEKEREEKLRIEREEKEREEKLRIEMEEKKKKQEEEERAAAAEKLRIEKEREEKEREEKLRIEKEKEEKEKEMNANVNTNVMNGFDDLEEELKKLEEEGRKLEEELTKDENVAQEPTEKAPESAVPEQPAEEPQHHDHDHDHDHEDENEGEKKEHKKRRKLKMLNTGTGRVATGQGIRRVPKALLAPPLETLTEIDLSYNRLTKFPEEFYAVPRLRVLNLSCNQIPSIPADIGRLSCLEVLVLRVNFIEEVPPEVFMLPNLTELAAHNCHIAQVGIPPEGPVAPLRILTLGHNRLTALPENIGALGRTLKRLCVDANALEELPESVGDLVSLTDLSIQDNFISRLPGSLRNLQRLEMFEAWDNCLCEIPDEWVPLGEDGSVQPPFANVTEFYLQKNEIAELPEWFFYMFGPRVQLIDLSANNLTALPPLDGVPNLAALFVGANALETLPASLPTKILACLDISRNRLQELPALYELRELQTLNAGFNPLCAPLPALPPGVIEAILPGLGLSTLPECSLPRLEILNLAINYLSDIPPGWLGSKSLRVCDISHNMLASLPPALAAAYEARSDFYMHVERNLFDLPLRSPALWCDADKICPIISIGVADTQGRRDSMEDSCSLHGDFLGDGQYDLVCMYDGHGGSKYSEAAARIFPAELAAGLCSSGEGEALDMEAVFRTAYHETNEAAADELPGEVMQGTTAVAALLAREDGVLHVANVGDTRAVMCRNGEAVRVSVDHKNLLEEEYLRIAAAGGYVTENGRLQGVLAMSRALGDVTLKPLVSDVPYYARVDVAPGDEFVILACDGVWDEVSDDVAVRVVKDALEEFGGDADKACIKLRDWAFMAGSGDNISVIIIKFDF